MRFQKFVEKFRQKKCVAQEYVIQLPSDQQKVNTTSIIQESTRNILTKFR